MWGLLRPRGFITALDKSGETGPGLLGPTFFLVPGRPGRQGSGSMTARTRGLRWGADRYPWGAETRT